MERLPIHVSKREVIRATENREPHEVKKKILLTSVGIEPTAS